MLKKKFKKNRIKIYMNLKQLNETKLKNNIKNKKVVSKKKVC